MYLSSGPISLGIVLTRGHGQYIFIGNVSVEEGGFVFLHFLLCFDTSSYSMLHSSPGLHDLLAPDLTIASEW